MILDTGFCCEIRQDVLGQYSMVNLELFNIVDEIRKVSKAFVVHPKNVNADYSTSMNHFFFPSAFLDNFLLECQV